MNKIMNSNGVTKKRLGLFLFAGLFLASALVFLPAVKDGVMADTMTGDGFIHGWMWSSNIGWINANRENVTISDDGKVHGYAWSSSLGWLRLDPATTSTNTYPASPSHGVQVDTGGTTMSGWARFCSVYQAGCAGAVKDINGTELGGWDGWVKLQNVTISTGGVLDGFAWGDLNLGWMSFGSFDSDPGGCSLEQIDISCNDLPNMCDPCLGACIRNCGGGPAKSVVCHVTPATGPVGATFRWYVAPLTDITGLDGNEEEYVYTWLGDAASDSTSNESSVTYTTAGPKFGGVSVTDSSGASVRDESCSSLSGEGINVCVEDGGTIESPNQVCCSSPSEPRAIGYVCEPPLTACTISISEADDYGITLHFSPSTPTYTVEGQTYFRSQTNQKVTLSNGCSGEEITTTDLPSGVGLTCSQEGTNLIWGPCVGLSGGDYWVGVYSAIKPNPPICRDISLNIGENNIPTEACFTGSIIN